MSNKPHTITELIGYARLNPYRLSTKTLQDFYIQYIEPNAYIFELENGDTINLIFNKENFCHLIGLSYFGYDGILGWDKLDGSPKNISQFSMLADYNRQIYRILNFNQLTNVLKSPDIYIYKASLRASLNYKSDYFAVINDGVRYYKLGIGTAKNGLNYGETFLVSLMSAPDNQEIDVSFFVKIINKKVIPKKTLLENSSNQQSKPIQNKEE